MNPIQLSEFKSIMLRDYGYTADDKKMTQLATDFLISLEAVLSSPQVDKIAQKEAKYD